MDDYSYGDSAKQHPINGPEVEQYSALGHPSFQHFLSIALGQVLHTVTKPGNDSSVFGLDLYKDPAISAHFAELGEKTDYTQGRAILIYGHVIQLHTKSIADNVAAISHLVSRFPTYTQTAALLIAVDQETYERGYEGLALSASEELHGKVVLLEGRFHGVLHLSDLTARLYGLNVSAAISSYLTVASQSVTRVKFYRTGSGQQFITWAFFTQTLAREYLQSLDSPVLDNAVHTYRGKSITLPSTEGFVDRRHGERHRPKNGAPTQEASSSNFP